MKRLEFINLSLLITFYSANQVKVLRSIKPISIEDVVIGQYKNYTDEPTVSKNSLTPTFAAATVSINNARWDGVPFMMVAGKALQSKRSILIIFSLPC